MKSKTSSFRILVLACLVPLLSVGVLTAWAGTVDTDGLNVNSNATFWGSVIANRGSGPVTNGLLLYYSFATNTIPIPDGSGRGNTGTVNGATWTTNGSEGGAYRFDGINDHIVVADNAALNSPKSFSFWAYIDGYPSEYPVLFEDGYGDGYYIQTLRYEEYPDSGWYIPSVSGGFYGNDSARLPTQQWTHVAFVYDGARLNLYLNGVLKASQSASPFVGDSGPLLIGAFEVGANPIDGILDEIRLYDRALTENEVQQLYRTSATGRNPGSVIFYQGIDYVSPLGDLSMGSYTNKP